MHVNTAEMDLEFLIFFFVRSISSYNQIIICSGLYIIRHAITNASVDISFTNVGKLRTM